MSLVDRMPLTDVSGATRACVDALVGDPQLEVLEVAADDAIDWRSDRVNPYPTGTED